MLFSIRNGLESKTIGLFLYRFGCTASPIEIYDTIKAINEMCGLNSRETSIELDSGLGTVFPIKFQPYLLYEKLVLDC